MLSRNVKPIFNVPFIRAEGPAKNSPSKQQKTREEKLFNMN